jgi:iron complex outermembrane receptor protein
MTVLDVSALYALTEQLDLGLAVRNLTSNYYEYVWWDGAQSLHSPADGRNVTLSIRARY